MWFSTGLVPKTRFVYRPMVEWSNTTDSKSVEPGFEPQSGDLVDKTADMTTASV